jgi:hypothetical protein
MDGSAIQSCSILTVASCCAAICAITASRSSIETNDSAGFPNAMAVAPAMALCTKSRRLTTLSGNGTPSVRFEVMGSPALMVGGSR